MRPAEQPFLSCPFPQPPATLLGLLRPRLRADRFLTEGTSVGQPSSECLRRRAPRPPARRGAHRAPGDFPSLSSLCPAGGPAPLARVQPRPAPRSPAPRRACCPRTGTAGRTQHARPQRRSSARLALPVLQRSPHTLLRPPPPSLRAVSQAPPAPSGTTVHPVVTLLPGAAPSSA